ncbi:hypothetical protein T492DRAFT_843416 [Pavlovales sp. CCMP2436]|nr:hypothetical protein T492DRAFT_843416 [Pavlovales sp. CCMP2436]
MITGDKCETAVCAARAAGMLNLHGAGTAEGEGAEGAGGRAAACALVRICTPSAEELATSSAGEPRSPAAVGSAAAATEEAAVRVAKAEAVSLALDRVRALGLIPPAPFVWGGSEAGGEGSEGDVEGGFGGDAPGSVRARLLGSFQNLASASSHEGGLEADGCAEEGCDGGYAILVDGEAVDALLASTTATNFSGGGASAQFKGCGVRALFGAARRCGFAVTVAGWLLVRCRSVTGARGVCSALRNVLRAQRPAAEHTSANPSGLDGLDVPLLRALARARAVVAFRVAPKQKAALVALAELVASLPPERGSSPSSHFSYAACSSSSSGGGGEGEVAAEGGGGRSGGRPGPAPTPSRGSGSLGAGRVLAIGDGGNDVASLPCVTSISDLSDPYYLRNSDVALMSEANK